MIAEQFTVEPFQIIVVVFQTFLVEGIVSCVLLGGFDFQRLGLGSSNFRRFSLRSLDLDRFGLGSLDLDRFGFGSLNLDRFGLGSLNLDRLGLGSLDLDRFGFGGFDFKRFLLYGFKFFHFGFSIFNRFGNTGTGAGSRGIFFQLLFFFCLHGSFLFLESFC